MTPRPSSASVVRLLLRTARRRAAGRRARARAFLRYGSARGRGGMVGFAAAVEFVMAIALSSMAAGLLQRAVEAGQRFDAARHGQVVVERDFLPDARSGNCDRSALPSGADGPGRCRGEAEQLARDTGGDPDRIEQRLRQAVRTDPPDRFVALDAVSTGLAAVPAGGSAGLLGLVALVWWAIMLVAHGEGLELDTGRRRHPTWEWVLTHPVKPGAMFAAEMLAPVAANPFYWGVPAFPGLVFGLAYGAGAGFAAAIGVGIPATIAAACLSKALEIAITLRLTPRNRGAAFGLLGWLGYVTATLTFALWFYFDQFAAVLASPLTAAGALPWPVLGWLLGRFGAAPPSVVAGFAVCDGLALALTPLAVGFSVWGARRGVSGATDALPPARTVARTRRRLGRHPMLRKEWLWFSRDRGAIVQVVLIPISVAALQLFNYRGLLTRAGGSWNGTCGAAILFGTYFLLVLGPKSLSSEGSALWIAMTWPRGLEWTLRAKARLWTALSTALVALPLAWAVWHFPSDAPAVLLVGAAWVLFAYGMAMKTVTLATAPGASGEPEPVPKSRQMATWLGTLTFSVGVLSRQWPMAIAGIVYSNLAGAAMWQNFRARLPFLFDPWSERTPPPPTVMHAMVAVAALVDGGAALTGLCLAFGGAERATEARTIGYTLAAVAVCVGVAFFLGKQGLRPSALWRWPDPRPAGGTTRRGLFLFSLAGFLAGIALGGLAQLYLLGLRQFAWARAALDAPNAFTGLPHDRAWWLVLAVLVAPPAEEFLFRGLLFRALDREWGRWQAVGGSALFFAIYHPVLSWLPVGVLGVCNALLFRRSGFLLPAVLLHAAYNAALLL